MVATNYFEMAWCFEILILSWIWDLCLLQLNFWCYMLSLIFLWAWKRLRGYLELLWSSPTIHNNWKMVIFISNKFYNSMEDWCANQNLFSTLKSLIKSSVYDVYPDFGGDGYLHLRWQLFFCMRTCDIFSLGEWFLTFFVHTDFYSFTTCKRVEIEVDISPKR